MVEVRRCPLLRVVQSSSAQSTRPSLVPIAQTAMLRQMQWPNVLGVGRAYLV
jgi:hypothetical protein